MNHCISIIILCHYTNIRQKMNVLNNISSSWYWDMADTGNSCCHFNFEFITYSKGTNLRRSHHCCDRMEDGFITTYGISVYHHYRCEFQSHSNEVYSIQHYVIKFVGDLRQVGDFLQVLPNQYKKWPPQYNWNIVESGVKQHKPTNL